MLDDRGSAAVEALAGTGFIVAFIAAGLIAAYVSFARSWIDRNAYEASVCLATDTPRLECERRFEASLESGLPIGELRRVALARHSTSVTVRGRWAFASAVTLRFDDRRGLPLRSVR